MNSSVIAIQILLAILLFFIVNWIGRHSISSGYIQLSLFNRTDEAPAFNFLFRVMAPVIYLFLVAAVFYALGLDVLVQGFYLVAVYYVLFRWLFNLATERGSLLNWNTQFVVAMSACTLAYLADRNLISKRENLLPDFSTVSNELWIIVLIFLYQTANRITFSSESTILRKRRYLATRYKRLGKRYGQIVAAEAPENPDLQRLVFAVLIYEMFNRPTVYRAFETCLLFPLGISRSLGPMQVQTDRHLSNEESVRAGARKLVGDFTSLGGSVINLASLEGWSAMHETLKRYNVRSDYPAEVQLVYEELASLDQSAEVNRRREGSEHLGTEPTP